jgi:hypothetical protein
VAPPAFHGTISLAVLHGKLGAADAVAGIIAAPSAITQTAGATFILNFMLFSLVDQFAIVRDSIAARLRGDTRIIVLSARLSGPPVATTDAL